MCQLQHVCPTPNLPPVVCLLELVQTVIRLGAADLGRFISYAGLTPGMRLVSGPLLQALNRWGLVLQALSPEEPWQRASANAAYLTMPLHGPTASWVQPFCYWEKVDMMEMSVTQVWDSSPIETISWTSQDGWLVQQPTSSLLSWFILFSTSYLFLNRNETKIATEIFFPIHYKIYNRHLKNR